MRIREQIVTDTGILIDPDDDAVILEHENYYEFVYGRYCIYSNNFYPGNIE